MFIRVHPWLNCRFEDHVTPVNAGGKTLLENLALACVSCSLRKGARRLHFRWNGVRLVGISPTGRATVSALKLNRAVAQAIRQEEAERHRHPPPKHL